MADNRQAFHPGINQWETCMIGNDSLEQGKEPGEETAGFQTIEETVSALNENLSALRDTLEKEDPRPDKDQVQEMEELWRNTVTFRLQKIHGFEKADADLLLRFKLALDDAAKRFEQKQHEEE